ncbi:MAG: hypothetical protein LC799_14650, partial [Actinobacteria bacterium]|nr:hypothetical protein [Actinomycetota bacterium]
RQNDHHCLPHRGQAPPTHRHQPHTDIIPTLSATHTIRRGTDRLRWFMGWVWRVVSVVATLIALVNGVPVLIDLISKFP